MARPAELIEALLGKVAYPFLALSGSVLHGYTVWTALALTDPGWFRYLAGYAAYALPPLSELVMVYVARWAFGSWVNAYSIWLLIWSLLLGLAALLALLSRLARR